MSDLSKHLSYFKVENFKRFKSLELKDIGQFNIIVGDNNTGKTSLLEALLINSSVSYREVSPFELLNNEVDKKDDIRIVRDDDIGVRYEKVITSVDTKYLAERFRQRKNLDKHSGGIEISQTYEYFFNNAVTKSDDDNSIHFELSNKQEKVLKLEISEGDDKVYSPTESIPFIGFGNFYDSTFEKKYAKYIQTSVSQKNKFTQRLKAFINDISYLDMSLDENRDMKLLIAESHKDATTEIGKFGEGSLKLARILVDTMVYADERLMIDEVEAGVHWSRFQVFWKTILLSAIENNTQLFMTTHDAECLQYLIEAMEDESLSAYKKDLRIIQLREKQSKDIAVINYNFDDLKTSFQTGNDLRGGHRI